MRLMSGLVCLTALAALTAAGLACAQTTPASVDSAPVEPTPPANLNTLPKWSEFPATPTDVPTVADIKTRVNNQLAKRAQLEAELAALVWDTQEPDAIAAAAKAKIDPAMLVPLEPAMTVEQIEAAAAALRAKATPPPVVK